jgi:hypothetical protein
VHCQFCERSPASELVIRRHVGMLVLQRFYKQRVRACRSCGWSMWKSWTLRTLVQGWWGYISFFANLFTLAMNAVAAVKIAQTPRPSLSSTTANSLDAAGWESARSETTAPDV